MRSVLPENDLLEIVILERDGKMRNDGEEESAFERGERQENGREDARIKGKMTTTV